jgi:tRNA modification GTPase
MAPHRAATADIKLCVLSLEALFPDTTARGTSNPAPAPAPIDPLTLSLIDRDTLIPLNKTDSFKPTRAHLDALRDALRTQGKEWDGGDDDRFWLVSVKEGEGLTELAQGLKDQVQRR